MSQRDTAGISFLKVVFDELRDGKAHSVRLAIASDFVVIDEGQVRTILDYRLRRRITVNANGKTFSNASLYAMVDFFYRESFNRRAQRELFRKLGTAAASPDLANPFWAQGELRLVDKDDEPVQIDRRDDASGAAHFLVGGEDVANFVLSDMALSAGESAGLAHFLLAYTSLHPAILKALCEGGTLPRSFAYAYSRGNQRGFDSWTLKSFERVTGSYPLPADYRPEVRIDAPEVAKLVPMMLEAIAGRAGGGPRSALSYRSALEEALAGGHLLQSHLLWLEFLLQYGPAALQCPGGIPCTTNEELVQKWQGDPVVASLLEASHIEAAGDPAKALPVRLAVSRDGLNNAYVLDDMIGNTYAETGDTAHAMTLIPKAIAGNPYIGGFYKDLGDLFLSDFDSFDAWTCYDLARALPGGETAPVVESVTANEKALASDYPQFF